MFRVKVLYANASRGCAAIDHCVWCISVVATFLDYAGLVDFSIDMQSNCVRLIDGSRYLMLGRRIDLYYISISLCSRGILMMIAAWALALFFVGFWLF